MATKKTKSTAKKVVRKTKSVARLSKDLDPAVGYDNETATTSVGDVSGVTATQNNFSLARKAFVLGIFVIFIAVLLYKNKSILFVAKINNRPITRLELDQRLVARYGSAMIDEMVSEQLIKDEGSAKQIKVSASEVDSKIDEITKRLGANVNINDLLSQQGMTMADLRRQIELQLLVEKLTVGLVNVSDAEITEYIDKNKATMTATDEAGTRKEALDTLASQKKGEAIQKWFTDLKAKAKITKYI